MIDQIKTTLPLSPDIMVEFFKNKDRQFLIDYDKTIENMSPKSILIYLSNLQIHCEFTNIDENLISEYLFLRDRCNIMELDIFLANCLHYMKYESAYMDNDLFDKYGKIIIETHNNILTHYKNILDSSTLFLFLSADELIDEKDIPAPETYQDNIGFCFLNLYKIPDFLITFLNTILPISEQHNFSEYFDNDNYMFKGQNLFGYFSHEDNLFFKYAMILQSVIFEKNEENTEKLIKIHEQL